MESVECFQRYDLVALVVASAEGRAIAKGGHSIVLGHFQKGFSLPTIVSRCFTVFGGRANQG